MDIVESGRAVTDGGERGGQADERRDQCGQQAGPHVVGSRCRFV